MPSTCGEALLRKSSSFGPRQASESNRGSSPVCDFAFAGSSELQKRPECDTFAAGPSPACAPHVAKRSCESQVSFPTRRSPDLTAAALLYAISHLLARRSCKSVPNVTPSRQGLRLHALHMWRSALAKVK